MSQPQTNVSKIPVQLIRKPESQRLHEASKNESIVCPIYPSKDFHFISPTNSNLKPAEKETEYLETQVQKPYVRSKDRPLRSVALGQDGKKLLVASQHELDAFFRADPPKAFSPQPSLHDRISFLPGPE